jgi:hypothetical protein
VYVQPPHGASAGHFASRDPFCAKAEPKKAAAARAAVRVGRTMVAGVERALDVV